MTIGTLQSTRGYLQSAVVLSLGVGIAAGLTFGGARTGAGTVVQQSALIGALAGLGSLATALVARRLGRILPGLHSWFGLALGVLAGIAIAFMLQPVARPT
jgi:hypothetical protein